MDILVKQVDLGFDSTIRDPAELPRGSAADGSQNVLYSRGTIKTPYGFGKVASDSLPLDSGNPVLANFMYNELDKSQHFLSITKEKIYRRNYTADTWEDKTQSGQALSGHIYHPVSQASILHTDGLALDGTGNDAYHHCIICPGGIAPIQRWAGKNETDFADLVGADGYHHTESSYTTHCALQVGALGSRLLLISARESNADNQLIENNQRIRWPMAGKLETWSGTGSGYIDLFDTGGYNVWGAQLGSQWIQYQNNSIWSLTLVGGTRVFEPDIEMPDLGLLSAHLLYSKNNVHYFIGNDFNIYAYFGGSNIMKIGDKIHRYLQRDLDPSYAYRSWLCMGAENSRLWLFIVPNDEVYITEAYAIDIFSGSWMKRDFKHKWATGGITSVALIGSGSYQTGETYTDVLATKSPPKVIAIGGATRVTTTATIVTSTKHGFIVGETVTVADCGAPFDGDHEILTTPDKATTATTFTYAVADSGLEANIAAGTATVDKAPTYQDAVNAAETYKQALTEVLTNERIVLGDSVGYVYQYDDDVSKDDTVNIPARHITEIYDLDLPSKDKLWPGIRITAKEKTTGTGGVIVSYRTASFETVATGWTAFTEQALTSEFVTYELTVWDTSKKIQFRFTNATGDTFDISNYELIEPQVQG